jgi:hypothetical protein
MLYCRCLLEWYWTAVHGRRPWAAERRGITRRHRFVVLDGCLMQTSEIFYELEHASFQAPPTMLFVLVE